MNIVFFAHPSFMVSQSMPRFTKMLSEGMKERGHTVEIWAPIARFSRLNVPTFYRKWLSYIDSYILFPQEIRKRIIQCSSDTLFVITDNALGPWIPLISNRPHVIHCHDFLAQRSALDEIPENSTSWTGKQYQAFIRRGYLQGTNFISVSEKTRQDLHKFLSYSPASSEVVYNGINQLPILPTSEEARTLFSKTIGLDLSNGYLLHVGGNSWYKNRIGVVAIYDALRLNSNYKLPLIMIGEKPTATLAKKQAASPFKTDIHFLTGISDLSVQLAYTGASVFLFPSLAEGFGWPIAEAMASGCPVITTNEAPMIEVAGSAGFFIPRQPANEKTAKTWAVESANVVKNVLDLSWIQRNEAIEAGMANIKRFDIYSYLNKTEAIYQNILFRQ